MTRWPWASRRAWRSGSSALACGVSCHWALSASTMRCWSGQRKSGMTRRPSRCMGTLTCGGVRPAAASRSWTRSSSSVRVAGGRLARTRAKRARPGRPAARSSWRPRRRRFVRCMDCARLISRRNGTSSRRGARSMIVRAAEVVGMPRRRTTSSGCRLRVRCTRMPEGALTCPCGTITSGRRSPTGQSPNSITEEEWPRIASAPHPLTAANHRPSGAKPA
jgi:hypothetical protein